MKLFTLLVTSILMPLFLASCSKTPVPPMAFGAIVWPGYEPAYLARELGYFKTSNLHLAEYGNIAEVQQAFRKHELHLAAVPLDAAVLLSQDIPDLKIILLLDVSNGARGKIFDALIVRDDDIGQYHIELVEFIRGWLHALEYLHGQPDRAMQIMAQHEHVATAQFAGLLQGMELLGMQRNRELMLGEAPAVSSAVEAVQRYLLERGLINMGAETCTLLETSLFSSAVQ